MRIFTASWFFPPNTSAEGMVTYKLLKHSKHQYDVCCSKSDQWSYASKSQLQAENVTVYPIDTDDIHEWVKECIRLFQKLNKKYHYSYVMTRSMPPESLYVGKKIQQIAPSVQWIASMADPVFRNPYEMDAYIYQDLHLRKLRLHMNFIKHPSFIAFLLGQLPVPKYQLLTRLYKIEQYTLHNADKIIMPSKKQIEYVFQMRRNRKYKSKCYYIPHSYDQDLYPSKKETTGKHIFITYVGYLDDKRMPYDFLAALSHLKKVNPQAAEMLRVQFVGNINVQLIDAVQAFFLGELVTVQDAVSYTQSLAIMKESDYLLHIDAQFDFIQGSIFCASKLIDYIGSGNKVLALTDAFSEAARVTAENGGIVLERGQVMKIAEQLAGLSKDDAVCQKVNETYAAETVAAYFDKTMIEGENNR